MGILNATPDSFFGASRTNGTQEAVKRAVNMLEEGADILDIGGQSTRPGAEIVSAEEEAKRVIPVIKAIHQAFPKQIISVDTFYAKVASQAVEAGASIINDVSGGEDPHMFQTAGDLGVPYVLMHRPGNSKTMQQLAVYDDIILDIGNYFSDRIAKLKEAKVKDIVLDPGFGFGKNLEHNYSLLAHLKQFQIFELPVLVGVSRKKMVQQVIHADAQNALNGTSAVHMAALLADAAILRVHDVKAAKEVVQIYMAIKEQI
jgi:dihydropteroate synthase